MKEINEDKVKEIINTLLNATQLEIGTAVFRLPLIFNSMLATICNQTIQGRLNDLEELKEHINFIKYTKEN